MATKLAEAMERECARRIAEAVAAAYEDAAQIIESSIAENGHLAEFACAECYHFAMKRRYAAAIRARGGKA